MYNDLINDERMQVMDENKCPEWLTELKATRVVYEGRVIFGETIIQIVEEDSE